MEPSDILRTIRDRFRRAVVDPGEQKLLDQLHKLRESERTLRTAADAGEQVREKLEETRAQAADLVGRLPRGARGLFCALGVLCVLALGILSRMYPQLYAEIVDMWGGPEHWAQNWWLQEYRWGAVRILQLGHFIAESIWPPFLLAFLLLTVWFVQRKLRRWQARTLLWALILLHLLVSCVFWLAPFHLLVGPLMRFN